MNPKSKFQAYLRDPLALLWRIGASRRLALLLFGALAFALLLSLLFPQAAPGMDATSYAQWLGAVRHRYGMIADWARAWGLDDLRSSWPFRLLLALLAFNLLISFADRLKASPVRRSKRAQLLVLLTHLGVLLALASFGVSERLGWQESVSLAEGQSYNSARLGGLTLAADSVKVLADERGAVVGWQSELSLTEAGQERVRGQLWAGRPWRYRSWLFWQTGYGLAAELVATAERGREERIQALSGQMSPLALGQKGNVLSFRAAGEEGYFAVPGQGLSFRLIGYDALPQRGIEGAVIQIQAYRSGQVTPLWEAFLQDQASLFLDGVEYRFQRNYYAILQLAFAPGLWLFVLGLLMILAGVLSWALTEFPLTGAGLGLSAQRCYNRCLRLLRRR
jgi:hypothetical protein